MPTLNPEKCYNLELGYALSLPIAAPLPENFLKELARMCKETLNLSSAELQKLELDFKKHVGPDASYKLKQDLENKLQEIYIRFSAQDEKKLPENLKMLMATKLYEEIDQCTPGFHDRVYEALSGFYIPTTIDALLTQIRTSIVDGAARQTTDEVHAHNRFTMVAAADGCGVPVLHPNDIYSGAISDSKIRAEIQLAFKNHYHAVSILNKLSDGIKGVLHAQYEYTGAHLPKTAYIFAEYGKFLDYLEKFFGDNFLHEDISEKSDYLLLNEESKVIDLNWKKIKQTLLYTLERAEYIDFSENERRCIKGLLEDNQASALKFLYSDGFITNAMGFSQFLSFLSHASFLTKHRLIINYLHNNPVIDEEFLQIINIIKHEPELFDAVKLFISDRRYLEDEFTQDEYGFSPFLRAIRSNEKRLSFLLTSFGLLTNARQVEILRQNLEYPMTPLLLMLYTNPKTFSSIIQVISSWPIDQQELIYSYRDTEGNFCNLLMPSLSTDIRDYKLIINAISSWPPENQVSIFNQKNIHGQNALIRALLNNLEAFQSLLDLISKLPPLQQTEILTQSYNGYPNLPMYAFKETDDDAYTQLLKLVSKLPVENQTQLFNQKDSKQKNILMHALEESDLMLGSYLVTPILDVIATFTPFQQVDIFSQVDADNNNFFMIALKHGQKIFSHVFERINQMSAKELAKLFTQADNAGNNLLMLAAIHQAFEFPALIKKIQRLPPESQHQILFQLNEQGDSILMLALHHRHIVAPIVELIRRNIKSSQSSQIFTLLGGHSAINALMLAAFDQPEDLAPILNLVSYLSPKEQIKILTQTNRGGMNALMIAITSQPRCVASLLKFITNLSIDVQISILKQLDLESYNSLMLVTSIRPELLLSLLKTISKLPEEEQILLFSQETVAQKNVLELADEPDSLRLILQSLIIFDHSLQKQIIPRTYKSVIDYAFVKCPEALISLLEAIEINKDKMLSLSKVGGLDKLATEGLSSAQKKTFLIIRLTLQLVALKHDIEALKTGPSTYKVANDLYSLLKKNLRTYKHDSNLSKLQSTWAAAINTARPLLSEHPILPEPIYSFIEPLVPAFIKNFGFFSTIKIETGARLDKLQATVDVGLNL